MKLCTAMQEGCGYKNILRASLLCSVGKKFHCVHYLTASLVQFKIRVTMHRRFLKEFGREPYRKCPSTVDIMYSVSLDASAQNPDKQPVIYS